jgi:microsomal epoxide hydrolase
MSAVPPLRRLLLVWLLLVPFAGPAAARERFFLTGDGVRLHYTVQGPRESRPGQVIHTIVFVPGLAMPGWIWTWQMAAFRAHNRVIAFDPRGQGDSEIAPGGYTAPRRGRDLADLLARLGPAPVLVVAWSLGVLDVLAYVHQFGDRRLAGLVLVDNSVGENPPPTWHRASGPPLPYRVAMADFVRGMFHTRQPAGWLDRLVAASQRLPAADERALRSYDEPRSFWRVAVEDVRPPLLYVVRPWLAEQAANLAARRPGTEVALFPAAGHALFVDDPVRFDALLRGFIRRRVWK